MMRKCNHLSILLFGLLSLFIFSNCETVTASTKPAPGSPVANAPKMAVGDTWTYKGWNGEYGPDVYAITVVKVHPDGSFILEKVSKRGLVGKLIGAKRWISTYNSMHRRIDPPEKKVLLKFPLFVGKKWVDRYYENRRDAPKFTYSVKNTWIVKDYERIKTKAGTFNAFRISRNKFEEDGYESESYQAEYWYSPEVKAIVKESTQWRWGQNLQSYRLAKPGTAKKSAPQKKTARVKQGNQQKKTPQVKQSNQQKKTPQVKQDNQQKRTHQVKQNDQQKVVTSKEKPKIIQPNKRIKIGILEFRSSNKEAKEDELGIVVSEMLTTSFVTSEAFIIIEREQLKKIVEELKLSESDIIDTSDVKRIGKIAGATAIVTGSVVKIGNHMRLDARIIDVESGIIVTAEKIEGLYGIQSIGTMTDQIVSNLVGKFYQDKK